MSESNVSRKIDNLRIGNDLNIKDDLTVGGDVSVTGTCGAGNTTITGTLSVSGNASHHRTILRQSAFISKALALTAAQNGALILLDKDEDCIVTLPQITASDIGISFSFIQTVVSEDLKQIKTKFAKDYFVGGLANLTTVGENGSKLYVIATNKPTIKLDANLSNCAGAIGSVVNCTAILTGNTGTNDANKLVWALDGVIGGAAANGDGSALFA